MNEFTYLIRREIWEHRALYIVPLVFLALTVFSTAVGFLQGKEFVDLSWGVRKLEETEHIGAVLGHVGLSLWVLFSMVSAIVATFYLLDSLWADRKDRSILFWKSLPVSDTSTVLSKLATGTLVAPMIAVATALLASLSLLLIGSIAVLMGGGNPLTLLWAQFPLATLVVKAVGVSLLAAVWFLPAAGWLLFSSAAARKTPFLFAALFPVGIAFVEELALDTNHFIMALAHYGRRFFDSLFADGNYPGITITSDEVDIPGRLSDIGDLTGPLTEPMLLLGLVIGAALIFATIYMRRHRVDAG